MATSFGRHTRACVDAALHRAFDRVRGDADHHSLLSRLARVVHAKSNLMASPPSREGYVSQVEVLENLARFHAALVRDPDDWPGERGHPLRVMHSLASHLFGRYPVPRFMASAWYGIAELQPCFIAHAQGRSVRDLPLPVALTRRMAHELLRTPDHVHFWLAIRRAEILGLGGTSELADRICATRLGYEYAEPERWRVVLAWLVRCGDSIDLAQVRPILDYAQAHLAAIDLRGRTFASVMRLVEEWHRALAAQRAHVLAWQRSRWNGIAFQVHATRRAPRAGEWTIDELLDSRTLELEGRAMRHCVATYAHSCATRWCSIWSLRFRWSDEQVARSVLTIEVRSHAAKIVQIRGAKNSLPRGEPLDLVRRWAIREGLALAAGYAA